MAPRQPTSACRTAPSDKQESACLTPTGGDEMILQQLPISCKLPHPHIGMTARSAADPCVYRLCAWRGSQVNSSAPRVRTSSSPQTVSDCCHGCANVPHRRSEVVWT